MVTVNQVQLKYQEHELDCDLGWLIDIRQSV